MRYLWIKTVEKEQCLDHSPIAEDGKYKYTAIHLCKECMIELRDTLTKIIDSKEQ